MSTGQFFDWQIFATLWLLLLIPLIFPAPSYACKIITKPLPWDAQPQPWNIFSPPKPTQPSTVSPTTTSYQPPSCRCGEKVGAGVKKHPWLVGIKLEEKAEQNINVISQVGIGLANDDGGALLCS